VIDLPPPVPSGKPQITALTWANAREVLPNEAHDFTPWLADNLDLLAEKLGLDELELVAKEWKVESFALDIFARGRDADGDVSVVIENQYGPTDHRHLGQILTYAAHAAATGHRVLAVWVTEEVRPAHLAAVEFINRIAAGDATTFGIVLLRVLFASATVGWHVHFEVEAEPNAFLAQPGPDTTHNGNPTTALARAAFIEAIVPLLDPPLEKAGLTRSGGINRKHGAVVYRLPSQLEIAKYATVRVICSRTSVNVALYLQHYPTSAQNSAVAEVLRQHYEPLLHEYDLHVDNWHGSSATTKRERILTRIDTGYEDGVATEVADEAAAILVTWAKMLTENPIHGIDTGTSDV
jgi:hypothetical protein